MTADKVFEINEDEITRYSFMKLKKDIEKYPETFFKESTIVARLYYYICNNYVERKRPDEFQRIRLEGDYSWYNDNPIDNEKERNQKMWECVKKNYPGRYPPKMKKVGKAGIFDLVILDSEKRKLSHVVEIKLLKDQGFNDGDRHRAYEDLYVLSNDFLGKNCHSSLFVFLIHGKNRKKSEINELFNTMEITYKNVGVINFESSAVMVKK